MTRIAHALAERLDARPLPEQAGRLVEGDVRCAVRGRCLRHGGVEAQYCVRGVVAGGVQGGVQLARGDELGDVGVDFFEGGGWGEGEGVDGGEGGGGVDFREGVHGEALVCGYYL